MKIGTIASPRRYDFQRDIGAMGISGRAVYRKCRGFRKMAHEVRFPLKAALAEKSATVKGFGCRPLDGRRRVFGGRRPKASKGGNRAGGTCDVPQSRARSPLNAAQPQDDWHEYC